MNARNLSRVSLGWAKNERNEEQKWKVNRNLSIANFYKKKYVLLEWL